MDFHQNRSRVARYYVLEVDVNKTLMPGQAKVETDEDCVLRLIKEKFMEKIQEWDEIWTRSYSFSLALFRDGSVFVGQLNGVTPRLAVPGNQVTYMTTLDEEEIRDEDPEKLIERVKTRIGEIDGEIILWR
jgi:hypothetical protein